MMLRTGNKGFTLIEIMVTVAILSLGMVLIYEAFFIVLDSFNYCSDYLNVASWIDEKIWQAQDSLTRRGSFDADTIGEFINRNKVFKWSLSHNPIDEAEGLHRIDLVLSWQEGKRTIRLSRSAYAIYEEK